MNAQNVTLEGTARVIDGDTLAVGPVKIRLHGIDAPETDQICAAPGGGSWKCGKAAIDKMVELADGRRLECRPTDRDAYGRIIAVCQVDGSDVAAELVRSGLSWAYLKYSDDYEAAEDKARRSGIGIWQEESQPPWDFRADQSSHASATTDRQQCPIKGNISRSGERIYHTPWSSSYGRTVIDASAGERWFCDEAEASAAGWRPSRSR